MNTRAMVKKDMRTHSVSDTKKTESQLFLEKLNKCSTKEEIAQLLLETMPPEMIRDRLAKITDNTCLLPFYTAALKVNADAGFKLRHVDYTTLALERYMQITGTKDIPKEKESLTADVQEINSKNIAKNQMMLKRGRGGLEA